MNKYFSTPSLHVLDCKNIVLFNVIYMIIEKTKINGTKR